MVGWQRSLQSILRHAGKRVEKNYSASINFSSAHINSSSSIGQSSFLYRSLDSPCTRILQPFHQYLQQLGISNSRKLLADSSSDVKPIPSPLTPVLALSSGNTESQSVVSKPSQVQAILKGIKQSPKKVNLVAALVRGMRVEDALLQLQVTIKRATKTVYQLESENENPAAVLLDLVHLPHSPHLATSTENEEVIHSARANATHNHGLDPDRLLIAEAFVGKGYFKKRISYHAKGKSGVKVRPECRLTVVVRETTPEEEAKIARLKVSNFRKLTKRESRLVPHKLIETTPVWNRKGKTQSREARPMY